MSYQQPKAVPFQLSVCDSTGAVLPVRLVSGHRASHSSLPSDGECPWEEEAFVLGKKWLCQPRRCTAQRSVDATSWHQTAPNSVRLPMPGARAGGSWQVKKGTAMSHCASHLLPGRAVRRPPTLCSANASFASGPPAGSFIWLWMGEVPGSQCEACGRTVQRRTHCGSVL